MSRAGRYYRQYQFQCQTTGIVKAYKEMSPREAKKRNKQLKDEESCCLWVAADIHDNMPNEGVYLGLGDD